MIKFWEIRSLSPSPTEKGENTLKLCFLENFIITILWL